MSDIERLVVQGMRVVDKLQVGPEVFREARRMYYDICGDAPVFESLSSVDRFWWYDKAAALLSGSRESTL